MVNTNDGTNGRTIRRTWAASVALASYASVIINSRVVDAYPRSRIIPSGHKECLYDKLEEDEYLTMSVFVSRGDRLEATAIMEGPVSPVSVNTGEELYADAHKFGRGTRFGKYRLEREPPSEEHENVDRTGTLGLIQAVSYENQVLEFDDDDEQPPPRPDVDDVEKIHAHFQALEEKREKRFLEREQAQKFMDGMPFEKTVKVYAAGWYRVCAYAMKNQVTVELEMRKSSELGIPSEHTNWHVPTEEASIEVHEEAEIDEEAAKEEDLEQFKEYIKNLYQQLSKVMKNQENEIRRMQVHKELNAHAHSRMVLGSLFETVLFIAVTGFQVHTIRKWFAGGPLLG